jgi:hypothetical protein
MVSGELMIISTTENVNSQLVYQNEIIFLWNGQYRDFSSILDSLTILKVPSSMII